MKHHLSSADKALAFALFFETKRKRSETGMES